MAVEQKQHTDIDPDGRVGELIATGHTLPSEWYASRAIFEAENELIFRRSWQYVGHSGQVTAPGDFFTCEVAGVPILVVRGKDQVLRAFLNICRHRHHPIAEGQGRTPVLICNYHAWSYKLDGSFNGAPRAKEDPNFDGSALCLTPVSVHQWGHMVFVNPDRDAVPFLDVMGPLDSQAMVRGLPIQSARYQGTRSCEFQSNWKITWDNACECYHCATIHPSWSKAARLGPEYFNDRPVGPFHFEIEMDQHENQAPDYAFMAWPAIFLMSGNIMHDVGSDEDNGVRGFVCIRFESLAPDVTRMQVDAFHVDELSSEATEAWLDGVFSVVEEDREPCERIQVAHSAGVAEPGTLIPAIDTEHHALVWERLVHRALTSPGESLYAELEG